MAPEILLPLPRPSLFIFKGLQILNKGDENVLSGILRNSWASLVAKNQGRTPLPMQEIQVRSLGWEDPLEEGMATNSSILAWRNP